VLLLAKIDHAFEDAAMLREEEVLGFQMFDGGVERVIIEKHSAENAAFSFEVMRERAFDRAVGSHGLFFYSPYFRLTDSATQERILRRLAAM
jgi:hypothetical protein